MQEIERRLGRIPTRRWGPRVIDIDLVLWGAVEMATDALTLPHPAFRERAFVLAPLAEVAPDAVDPSTGLTVAQLERRPEARGGVRRLEGVALHSRPR
jgi:2-amino-4-hydroxy-6-hydroxymethyldihydropteridine diphosphokinase